MRMEAIRQTIVDYGKRLMAAGLTKGTGGNISYYDREEGLIAITPTGYTFDEMTPETIVLVDIDGNVVEGELKPTSEISMHLGVLRAREDINAVMHAHTTYATALACLRESLPAVDYMIAVAGPDVRCAEYATYGTPELAENALQAMEDRYAVLLANHGVLTGSHSVANAFNILEEVEYCAKLYILARSIGNPVILDDEEMARMAVKFKHYGQAKGQ